MYQNLVTTINNLIAFEQITEERKAVLQPLIAFVTEKTEGGHEVNINFICTHNSRRSHFSQIWAQVAAAYYGIPHVQCYSGGTEETALFPMVVETLAGQGLEIATIADGSNPVYAIKYDENSLPIIGFSKKYDSPFNPASGFAAVMTCSQADGGCPLIAGVEKRIPVTFEDPKTSDHSDKQAQVYAQRSLEIAREMFYIFSMVKK